MRSPELLVARLALALLGVNALWYGVASWGGVKFAFAWIILMGVTWKCAPRD